MIRWKIYWITLAALLCGALFYKNRHLYSNKSRRWQFGKTGIEAVLLVLSAVFMPIFLVIYGSMWITKPIKSPVFRVGAGVLVSIALMWMGTFFLEMLVLIGILGIEIVSAEFLRYLQERREKRLIRQTEAA